MNLWRKHPSPQPDPAPFLADSEADAAMPRTQHRDPAPVTRSAPASIDLSDAPEVRAHAVVAAQTPRVWLHVSLFLLTLLSMTAAGALQRGVNPFAGLDQLVHLVEGIPYAAALLGILTVHELGHYFAARRWGVQATLPYFLPLPIHLFGTLGAVIRLRSQIPHKRALLDIGAAGPLAGVVVAIIACAVGLPQSRVVSPEYFQQSPFAHADMVIQLGEPLLFKGLAALFSPEVGPEQTVILSPLAFAGWVGLFITAVNLFPVGQLDGGHICYALWGQGHRLVGRATFGLLLGSGIYGILSGGLWGWIVFAFFLALLGSLFGWDHPSPHHPAIPLNRWRRGVGLLCLLVFALCFTPVPFGF